LFTNHSNYGFLTWTNAPGQHPSFCCAPRWCQEDDQNVFKGISDTQMNGLVGSDIALGKVRQYLLLLHARAAQC